MEVKPLGTSTIYVVRAPLVPGRTNSLERDWESATETEYTGFLVQPFMMAEKLNFEDMNRREFVRTAFRFSTREDVDVLATDRIRWNDEIYEVFGEPGKWPTFRSTFHHTSFIARLSSG